jgi:hypothetical protein
VIKIQNTSIEILKCLGLVLMTLDHVNSFILNHRYPMLFEAGRMVMPIFAFVLAYNLARFNNAKNQVYKRVIVRMVIFGTLATPFFIALNPAVHYGYPLNILFTLAASTVCIYFLDKGENTACFLSFLLLGGLVEYFWVGIAFVICSWQFCRTGKKGWLLLMLLSQFPIGLLNNSMIGSSALLLILVASKLNFDVEVRRNRNFFYAYYPAHLACLFFSINIR